MNGAEIESLEFWRHLVHCIFTYCKSVKEKSCYKSAIGKDFSTLQCLSSLNEDIHLINT